MGITNLQKSETIEPTVPMMLSYYGSVSTSGPMLLLNITGKGKMYRLSLNGQSGGTFQSNQNYGFVVTVDGKTPFNLEAGNTNFTAGISAPSSNTSRANALDFIQEIPFKSSLRVEIVIKNTTLTLALSATIEYGLV